MPRCEMCDEWPYCPWKTDPEIMCGEFHPKPMTNAIKIRSMTDEELAKKMSGLESFALTCGGGWPPEKWLDWLKEEAASDG